MPPNQILATLSRTAEMPAGNLRPFVNPVTGRRSWRHIIGVSILAVAALLIGSFCIMFFLVNARVVYEYLFVGSETTLKAMSEQASAVAAPGLWGRLLLTLRHWSVDYSAMTPFKLSLFFVFLLIYSVRSLSGRISGQEMQVRAKVLPFFNSLETTLVQLGLVGTIWGFLLIGWRMSGIDLAKGTTSALRILLDAFGTALLSTFTGVVLAYIFAPLLRHLWVWLHALQPAPVGVTGLHPAVRALTGALHQNVQPTGTLATTLTAARQPTEDLTKSIQLLWTQMEVVRSDLEKRGKLAELEAWVNKIVTGAQSIVQALNAVTPAAGALTTQVSALTREIERIANSLPRGNPLSGLETRFDTAVKHLGGLQDVLTRIETIANTEASRMGRIEGTATQIREEMTAVGGAIRGVGEGIGRLAGDSAAIRAVLGEVSIAATGQLQMQSKTNELLLKLSSQVEGLRGEFTAGMERAGGSYPIATIPSQIGTDPRAAGKWWWPPNWFGGSGQ